MQENITQITKQVDAIKLRSEQKAATKKAGPPNKDDKKDNKPQTAAQQKQQMAQMAGGALSGLAQEWRQLAGSGSSNKPGMIAQAKAAIESEKNAAMAELKNQVSTLSLEIAEKVLRDELSNKESQTKLVEKMLGDAKLN